jgi:hypothetical protein
MAAFLSLHMFSRPIQQKVEKAKRISVEEGDYSVTRCFTSG